MENRPTGVYLKKLIFHLMSLKAIPKGGGIKDGLEFLLNKDRIKETCLQATQEAFDYVDLVKSAPDNPYKTDEEIAKAILDKMNEKRK